MVIAWRFAFKFLAFDIVSQIRKINRDDDDDDDDDDDKFRDEKSKSIKSKICRVSLLTGCCAIDRKA